MVSNMKPTNYIIKLNIVQSDNTFEPLRHIIYQLAWISNYKLDAISVINILSQVTEG